MYCININISYAFSYYLTNLDVEIWFYEHMMTVPLFPLLSQHVVFVVKFFVAWLIPDVPTEVKARIKRERYLVQEYLHNYEVEKLKMQLSQSFCLSTETASLLPSSPSKHQVLSECIWISLNPQDYLHVPYIESSGNLHTFIAKKLSAHIQTTARTSIKTNASLFSAWGLWESSVSLKCLECTYITALLQRRKAWRPITESSATNPLECSLLFLRLPSK